MNETDKMDAKATPVSGLASPVSTSLLLADQGQKKDLGKLPYHLLPYDAIEEVVKVLQFGANKYRDRGWEDGIEYSRIFGAVFRHMTAWWRGEDKDPETGFNHLAHAACEVLFLLAFETRHLGSTLDDRNLNEMRRDITA